jgi:hypothetical protein
MSEEAALYPLAFDDLAEFQAAWSTIVGLASVFVPGPELAPQTRVVVEISAPGLGAARLRGVAAFLDVDSWGRKGVVVSLDVADLGEARQRFEAAPKPAAIADTLLKATPAGSAPPGDGGERLEPGTLLDGRFQIEGHLASGGLGDVSRAAHVY